MGTRCLTIVLDNNGNEIMNMYRQFDGYPDGHGIELAKFLENMQIVNGIGEDEEKLEKFANGLGCLSAQIVAFFKKTEGGIYLYAPGVVSKTSVDYVYTITGETGKQPKMRCESLYNSKEFDDEMLFSGLASDFILWLKESGEN